MSLTPLRERIDLIDAKILDLLQERAAVVAEIGRFKQSLGLPVYVPEREKQVLERLARRTRGHLPPAAVRAVFREVISVCRELEKRLRVAYLGPEGTYTHLAARERFGASTDLVPLPSLQHVFNDVERGRADVGVVPIENSTEGFVSHTLDLLAATNLQVVGEVIREVSHDLLSPTGTLRDVRTVYSHGQALAQCRHWLAAHLPGARLLAVASTARAAQRAARDRHGAAIAAGPAADLYGLRVMARRIEDSPQNVTRFLVIGREIPTRTGDDKTSLMFYVKDEVGILHRMLGPFARRKINLCNIESRPTKGRAWEYLFFLDLEGHIAERRVAQAVEELARHCLSVKILGSYPRGDGRGGGT